MKKVIVALMFVFAAGMFGSTVNAMTTDNIEIVKTDKEKDKKKKKKAKKGDEKSCGTSTTGEKKSCCSHGGEKK